jgi:hypothetical protein
MSGTKAFAASGISPVAAQSVAMAGLASVGAVAAVGVGLAGAAVIMTAKAVQAYHKRAKEQIEKARQEEEDIQRQILEARRVHGRNKISVTIPSKKLEPSSLQSLPNNFEINAADAESKISKLKINELKALLPRIRDNYQNLINRDILDEQNVLQALQSADKALDLGDVATAQLYIQALDDARIQATEKLRSQQQSETQFAQDRLNTLKERLPEIIVQHLQSCVEQMGSNSYPPNDSDLLTLHRQITEAELQANSVWEAAENLVNAWQDPTVDYVARIIGIDDGDVMVEVETHQTETSEKVNTIMRVQFDGQQVDLFGPHEETSSCAARTKEALQIFQEQGYYLEWTSLDGEPVPEEYRQVYAAENGTGINLETSVYEEPQRRAATEIY